MSVALDLRPASRVGLTALCLSHAGVFAWAASSLPWRGGTTLAWSLTLLSVLHVSAAACALLRKPGLLLWTWRALSVCSLLVFLGFSWSLAAAAVYVSTLYLGLGPVVASALWIVGGVVALLTLPVALWGALRTLPARTFSTRTAAAGAGGVVALFVLTLPLVSRAAASPPAPHVDSKLVSDIGVALEGHAKKKGQGSRRSVAGVRAQSCERRLPGSEITLFVSYVHRSGAVRTSCLQQPTGSKLKKALRRVLRKARAGSTVVVDLVKSAKELGATSPLVDTLKLRPGVDGVCEGTRCLTAWQLALGDVFSAHTPLPAVPDMTFGFSAARLRALLGQKGAGAPDSVEGLVRIETETYAVDASGPHRLARTRAAAPALSRHGVQQAVEQAERFIAAAQERDGTFRYTLDPATGAEDSATLNLPRQAGTAYALCEQTDDDRRKGTVSRALAALHGSERRFGEVSALAQGDSFGLGRSALPLLAMLRCRSLVGPENDRLIGQLSRLMLRMQRENGSFFPAIDPKTERGAGGHEALYAAGQAVLSLVLLEQALPALAGSAAEPLPAPATLRTALSRAMDHYAGPYWPTPLRDIFFFEEGWHCLAARTALSSHRHEDYERLCLDYVASRARFILRKGETTEASYVGGYGVSNLFPPRTTPTAGFGEALDAAIAIKLARGMNVAEDRALLRDVMTFLLRAQWSDASCYACKRPGKVAGGFSEHLAAPEIRIDYVQHAMAALGHGARLLELN